MKKLLGQSWKTTLVGYLTAIFIAVQPIMTETINWDSKHEVIRYAMHVILAAAIAFFGKYAADSQQVKQVDAQVQENSEKIDQTHEVAQQAHTLAKKKVTNGNKATTTARKSAGKK